MCDVITVVWPLAILLGQIHLTTGKHKLFAIPEVLYLTPQGECGSRRGDESLFPELELWLHTRSSKVQTYILVELKTNLTTLYFPVSRRRELTRHTSSSREAVQGKSSRNHSSLGVNSRWKSAMHWINEHNILRRGFSREDQIGAACPLRRCRSLWRPAASPSSSRSSKLLFFIV